MEASLSRVCWYSKQGHIHRAASVYRSRSDTQGDMASPEGLYADFQVTGQGPPGQDLACDLIRQPVFKKSLGINNKGGDAT
jgi:hypothetical protein